jgi:hypothetical protein
MPPSLLKESEPLIRKFCRHLFDRELVVLLSMFLISWTKSFLIFQDHRP